MTPQRLLQSNMTAKHTPSTRLSHFPIQQVTENLCYLPPFLQYTNTPRGYQNEWKNLRKDRHIPTEKTR